MKTQKIISCVRGINSERDGIPLMFIENVNFTLKIRKTVLNFLDFTSSLVFAWRLCPFHSRTSSPQIKTGLIRVFLMIQLSYKNLF